MRKMQFIAMGTAIAALSGAQVRAESAWAWGKVVYADASEASLTTTNSIGDAKLEDADLDSTKTPVKIVFQKARSGSGAIGVGQIVLTGKTIAFEGATAGTTLKSRGGESMFDLSGNANWTFRGLSFVGPGSHDPAPYDGGAIFARHGALTLESCSFTNFNTRFSGGAVSAWLQDDDMLVTNCTFVGNRAHPINGYGGAIYASASLVGCRVTVTESSFTGNMAENGGAICTLKVADNLEEPIRLAIDDKTTFESNAAVYEGGAIIAEGSLDVSGSNTLFRANHAGLSGGAVCVTGIESDFALPCVCTVSNATFNSNWVGTNTTWSAGGAIAIMPAGCELHVGGYAHFTNNVATTDYAGCGQPSLGGAIYTGEGVTNAIVRTSFVGNNAKANGTTWCYGGAISADGGATTIDTCVFDCGTSPHANCYGNAVDFNITKVFIRNSTFRRGTVEAVSSCNGSLAITNCVILGNGLGGGNYDVYVEGDTAITMAYTAYGRFGRTSGTTYAVTNNLAARVPGEVYDGDALKLRATGFNPVAGLGLRQSAKDFDGVAYGSKDYGCSMGAYEAPTERLLVVLDGSKVYDTTTSSNGCHWTWKLYTNEVSETEAVWTDLGDVDKAFFITNWTFGAASIGSYCSTNAPPNDIKAGVEGKTATVEWLRTVLDFLYTGTISKESSVVVIYYPKEFAWEGTEITPGNGYGTVIVSNTVSHTVLSPDEYVLSWADNIDPTATAKLIVKCTKNYDFIQTNAFAITAYLTEYTYRALNGTLVDSYVTTNGTLSGSNVVAVLDERTGYCLDYQNSKTNDLAYVYGTSEVPGDPNITTLTMLYETDVVGEGEDGRADGIPDKYQKKVLFATVNGYWNGESNGADRYIWVTLTNTTVRADGEGTWDTNGRCALSAARVPGVGEKPLSRFAKESEEAGTWNNNPYGAVIDSSSLPIFFYSPASVASPRSGDGKKSEPLLTASAKSMSASAKMLSAYAAPATEETDSPVVPENALVITGFEVGSDGSASGTVMGQVLDANTGNEMKSIDLPNANIEVWGAPTLEGPWTKVDVKTDENSVWKVSRVRTSGSASVTRSVSDDRTSSVTTSDATEPKFFKVRLLSE